MDTVLNFQTFFPGNYFDILLSQKIPCLRNSDRLLNRSFVNLNNFFQAKIDNLLCYVF